MSGSSASSTGEPQVAVEYLACPRCKGGEYYRSRTKGTRERFLRVALPILYFRCRTCGLRGARWYSPYVPRWRRRLLEIAGPVLAAILVIQAMTYLAGRGVTELKSVGPVPTKRK